MIDLEGLIDGPFELDRVTLHFGRFDRVLDLSIGAEQTAAVHAETLAGTHETELDGEPKEASHRFNDAGQSMDPLDRISDSVHDTRRRVRALSESHQGLGEMPVRMHGHVACDVMEDIGFGKIIELIGPSNRDRGRKHAIAQTIEEYEGGNVAAHRLRLKTGQWLQQAIDFFQPRDPVRVQAERMYSFQKMRVRVPVPTRRHPRVQPPPSFMVFFRIQL